MANSEHFALLKQDVEVWNKWYQANPGIEKPDLHGANLSRTDLRWADLCGARLQKTVFSDVNLAEVEGLKACLHDGPSTGVELGCLPC